MVAEATLHPLLPLASAAMGNNEQAHMWLPVRLLHVLHALLT